MAALCYHTDGHFNARVHTARICNGDSYSAGSYYKCF